MIIKGDVIDYTGKYGQLTLLKGLHVSVFYENALPNIRDMVLNVAPANI